jgi:hypothetical protein
LSCCRRWNAQRKNNHCNDESEAFHYFKLLEGSLTSRLFA